MISVALSVIIIIICCILGIAYAYWNAQQVYGIKLSPSSSSYLPLEHGEKVEEKQIEEIIQIQAAIQEVKFLYSFIYQFKGAEEFLKKEYAFITFFMAIFAVIILFAVDLANNDWNFQFYTTFAFCLGAFTSLLAGYVGMKVAVAANAKVTYRAMISLGEGFKVAFKGGCVLGFFLTSIGLLFLCLLILAYRAMYLNSIEDYALMMDCVAGYGLGGSAMALFGRVGGGIYTKAADVGADLVGKVEKNLPEDSPYNPATIADNVGDNVGDIAGMGADLFGSFAESTSAALAIAGANESFYNDGNDGSSMFFPLLITAFGIIICFVTSFAANYLFKVEQYHQIESALKYQLIISTVLLTPTLWFAAVISLPEKIQFFIQVGEEIIPNVRTPTDAFICAACGLWSGLIIGWWTEYMTSHAYSPVKDVAYSCTTGAATNIIYGLALGYLSTILPIICLGITCFVANLMLGMFGVALAALGILSNLCISLAVDGYGPISDNAGGIAEMAQLGENVRDRTDALDAAGNTTAAIGKGFAIGSAALVSLSLYGAFITRAKTYGPPPPKGFGETLHPTIHYLVDIELTDPMVFAGLIMGAMLPYAFSALTMKAVGKAANQMVQEVRRQLTANPGILRGEVKPDYRACVGISTDASLKKMICPGALVIFTPILTGFFFGPKAVAGVLPGALVSGVQMAISMSNTGGAWDNAKKFIESGQLYVDGIQKKKQSDEHKAAVIGDTVGDPLKDTSGPSLNILVKLSAIISLIFTKFFCQTGIFVCALKTGGTECPNIQAMLNYYNAN